MSFSLVDNLGGGSWRKLPGISPSLGPRGPESDVSEGGVERRMVDKRHKEIATDLDRPDTARMLL